MLGKISTLPEVIDVLSVLGSDLDDIYIVEGDTHCTLTDLLDTEILVKMCPHCRQDYEDYDWRDNLEEFKIRYVSLDGKTYEGTLFDMILDRLGLELVE